MVYLVGFEPTHPEGTDLQSAVTLQLHRKYIESNKRVEIDDFSNKITDF